MGIQLFNQYDPKWSKHALGTGAGELGPYGCFLCVLDMIAYDAFGDMHYTPDKFDENLNAARIFQGDQLPNDALDRRWPGRFQTTRYSGFRADVIAAAVPSPDTYVFLWIANYYSPLWRMKIATHFVLAASKDGAYVGDPAGGVMRSLMAAYGGPAAVGATSTVKRLALPAPVQPKPPVVINQPPPIIPPVVVVMPTPVFTWRASDGTISVVEVDYETSMASADRYAKSRAGVLVEVLNSKNLVVGTAFYAPPPAPTKPVPAPAPTPPPVHVQQPDIWSIVQNMIIGVILSMRREWRKLPGQFTQEV